ncbi:hypothetical protein RRG08_005319 [Elysia crispata]|uniref:Uncharacterized protein n=1 Tax=Elysia crispata TaxID=231223 RepID=A0AAE1D822_9GAST|nr:hypothetical protein RRG08_005319 [Elysia crispata]
MHTERDGRTEKHKNPWNGKMTPVAVSLSCSPALAPPTDLGYLKVTQLSERFLMKNRKLNHSHLDTSVKGEIPCNIPAANHTSKSAVTLSLWRVMAVSVITV